MGQCQGVSLCHTSSPLCQLSTQRQSVDLAEFKGEMGPFTTSQQYRPYLENKEPLEEQKEQEGESALKVRRVQAEKIDIRSGCSVEGSSDEQLSSLGSEDLQPHTVS